MNLEDFCNNVSRDGFIKLNKTIQKLFVKYSKYCIQNNKGKVDLARKILNYYKTRKYNENTIKGLKALFLALKFFKTKEYKRLEPKNRPFIKTFIGKQLAITIQYEIEFKNLYSLLTSHDDFGMDKDLNLNENDLKETLIDLFSNNSEISKIVIDYRNKLKERNFYDEKYGIIYDISDCKRCKIKKNEIEFCKKHLRNEKETKQKEKEVEILKDNNTLTLEDYSDKSFVVRGEDTKKYKEELKNLGGRFNKNLNGGSGWIFSNKRREEVESFLNKNKKLSSLFQDQLNKKECNTCGLLNDSKNKNCIACESELVN